MGVARIFQKGEGGGGVILCQTEGAHQIVVFSPPEYCRLFALKKRQAYKGGGGGGVTGTSGPP